MPYDPYLPFAPPSLCQSKDEQIFRSQKSRRCARDACRLGDDDDHTIASEASPEGVQYQLGVASHIRNQGLALLPTFTKHGQEFANECALPPARTPIHGDPATSTTRHQTRRSPSPVHVCMHTPAPRSRVGFPRPKEADDVGMTQLAKQLGLDDEVVLGHCLVRALRGGLDDNALRHGVLENGVDAASFVSPVGDVHAGGKSASQEALAHRTLGGSIFQFGDRNER